MKFYIKQSSSFDRDFFTACGQLPDKDALRMNRLERGRQPIRHTMHAFDTEDDYRAELDFLANSGLAVIA